MKPSDFRLGSIESRAAARVQFELAEREPEAFIRLRVIHVGHDGKEPLPASRRVPWRGGVTEIIHLAGDGS
jgi:hypothetical protein